MALFVLKRPFSWILVEGRKKNNNKAKGTKQKKNRNSIRRVVIIESVESNGNLSGNTHTHNTHTQKKKNQTTPDLTGAL